MRRTLGPMLVLWLVASVLTGCGADDGGAVDAGAIRRAAPKTTMTTPAPARPTTTSSSTTTTTTAVPTTTTAAPLDHGEVGVGDEGWLFHPGSYEPMCEEIDVAAAASRMRRLADALAQAGKTVVFFIAPDKGAVYQDKLGPLEASFDCAEDRRAKLRAALAAEPPAGFIDVWEETQELRAASDELLYLPHDSHWTTFTAINIAELVVDEFGEGAWDESSVRYVAAQSRGGDLANKSGHPRLEIVNKYEVDRDGVIVTPQQWGKRSINTYTTDADENAPILPGRLLVVHDSYGNWLKGPLTNHIEESWFVHWRLLKQGVVSSSDLAEIAADSDYVVIEVAERLSYERFLEDLPRMHEVFEKTLAAEAVP